MVTNTTITRDAAHTAVVECRYQTPGKPNASTSGKLKVRRKPACFATVESNTSQIRPNSVSFSGAVFELDETQAVEFARALLGPGYRVERVE